MVVSAYNVGDSGSVPGLGRSPGDGGGNPLQYYCLENPMDGGAWQTTVHGVAKSQTRLNDFNFTTYIHVSIVSQICFPIRLLYNIQQSSPCYTVGPCWLSILKVVVCSCPSKTP